LASLGDWGYLGAFVTQCLNSLTVLFPSLGHVVIVVLAASLNPWLLGLVGGVGAGIGELSGYLVGVSGRQIVDRRVPWVSRRLRLTKRWGGGAVFLFAVMPLPFDLVGIWAGSIRYPLWRFLAYAISGKVVKVTAIAFAGRQGIAWIESLW
jgi:membrane protein DedA with SNARE-associated domain